jgi:hypothetical protein
MSSSGDDYEFDVDDLPTDQVGEPEHDHQKAPKPNQSSKEKGLMYFIFSVVLTLAVMVTPIAIYYWAGFEWAVMAVLSVVWFTCLQILY